MNHLHVTDASFLFTLSSLVGLWYSVGILPRYLKTYRETRSLSDSVNRRLAEGLHLEIMVGEIVRFTIHLLFLVAGVWSILLTPDPLPPGESQGHILFGVYFLWTLVVANILITLNTLIVRRGYRNRRGEGPPKLLPSRDEAAQLLMRVRRLERRAKAEDARDTRIEARADTAYERANVAEAHADAAHERADVSDEDLADHEVRIETTEDVLEIKRTVTKKEATKEDGNATGL